MRHPEWSAALQAVGPLQKSWYFVEPSLGKADTCGSAGRIAGRSWFEAVVDLDPAGRRSHILGTYKRIRKRYAECFW